MVEPTKNKKKESSGDPYPGVKFNGTWRDRSRFEACFEDDGSNPWHDTIIKEAYEMWSSDNPRGKDSDEEVLSAAKPAAKPIR